MKLIRESLIEETLPISEILAGKKSKEIIIEEKISELSGQEWCKKKPYKPYHRWQSGPGISN